VDRNLKRRNIQPMAVSGHEFIFQLLSQSFHVLLFRSVVSPESLGKSTRDMMEISRVQDVIINCAPSMVPPEGKRREGVAVKGEFPSNKIHTLRVLFLEPVRPVVASHRLIFFTCRASFITASMASGPNPQPF